MIKKNCLRCGKAFKIKKSKECITKFCSKKCYYNYKIKENIKLKCNSCGKDFFVKPYDKNRKFCSKNCSNKSKIGKKPWNIGLTNEIDERIKKSSEKRIGAKRTEESINKIREGHKGQKSLNKDKNYEEIYGFEGAEIQKQKLRDNAKINPNYGMRGKKISEEVRKNMEEKIFSKRRDKTMGEIFGEEKAKEIRKKHSATKQGIPLEKWEKFISFEPYDERWTPQFRNSIRKRDNQICMNCGIHREKLNKALSIHHINYDKKNSIQENCLSLCGSCHTITQTNREYWQKLFQEKLSKLYDYKYSENGEIILKLEKENV